VLRVPSAQVRLKTRHSPRFGAARKFISHESRGIVWARERDAPPQATPRIGAARGRVMLPSSRHAYPHSLYPQTMHFTHPSAKNSSEAQSGHVPMNVSPGS